jgi:hypothetical protein
VLGGITELPSSWGHKYRDLALQVGGGGVGRMADDLAL